MDSDDEDDSSGNPLGIDLGVDRDDNEQVILGLTFEWHFKSK